MDTTRCEWLAQTTNIGARINESTTGLHGPDGLKGLHPGRPRLGRDKVHQQQHRHSVELLPSWVGNERCNVITQSTQRITIMENETTRKFPRTFTEAFPNSLENGAAIEIHVHECSIAEKLIRVISLIGLIVVALDCLVWRA